MNLLYPEIEGLINLLESAKKLGLRRVILIGCFSSVAGGMYRNEYNETHWADPDKCDVQERVRYFVEKTAWFYIKQHEKFFDFTVFLPTLMIGPINKKSEATESIIFLEKLAENKFQKLMETMLGFVDVRDVAWQIVESLDAPVTYSGRYILSQGTYWLEEIFKVIHQDNQKPTIEKPSLIGKFVLRFLSLFDSSANKILEFHGKEYKIEDEKTKGDLKIHYRRLDESIADTLQSLQNFDRISSNFHKL
jgi:nucleoside-diphosphate-sugar epimerase